MTVAELRRALADLPGDAHVDLVLGIHGPNTKGQTELVKCEPVILKNLYEGYVVITTVAQRMSVEGEYGFIPRRKYSE